MSDFSERTRLGANTALTRCLTDLDAVDPRVVVTVVIRLGRPIPAEHQDAIRRDLLEISAVHGGARLRIDFPVDASLGETHEVGCRVADTTDGPGPTPPERRPPPGPTRVLVLTLGRLSSDHLLSPRAGALAIARPLPGERPEIMIPARFAAVPRGTLLELLHTDDTPRLRRTAHRREEYEVLVDDVVLSVDEQRPVPPRGVITYRALADGTVGHLHYDLIGWSPGDPPEGAPCDPGDGAPHEVTLTVDGRAGVVRVIPPPAGAMSRLKHFPLPGTDRDAPVGALSARVLTTTGTGGPGDGGDWHVKIYRCLTPEHARALRRHLGFQADLVQKVNAGSGFAQSRPPWAIAPVHVLDADASRPREEPAMTGTALSEEEIVNLPEYRLSAWFGRADRPQPGCHVIVLAPRLKPVRWAGSDHYDTAPGTAQLKDLRGLALAVDQCHGVGIAHCDITPDNICRHPGGVGHTGYVLVDGDSVCRVDEADLARVRFTAPYAAPHLIEAAAALRAPSRPSRGFDLREHDRFGFVLVVLTALLGRDRVDDLVREDDRGTRLIDSPEAAATALTGWSTGWAGDHTAVVGHLAGALRTSALAGDDWRAVTWLETLTRLCEDVGPPAPAVTPAHEDPDFSPGRFHHRITAIRDRVSARTDVPSRGLRGLVVRELRTEITGVYREQYRRCVALFGLLPVVVAVIALISVVVNR